MVRGCARLLERGLGDDSMNDSVRRLRERLYDGRPEWIEGSTKFARLVSERIQSPGWCSISAQLQESRALQSFSPKGSKS